MNDCRLEPPCLTNGFDVDRACCDADVRDNINTTVRQMLRTDQLQISCRSAAEDKNGVTITFYQLQNGLRP